MERVREQCSRREERPVGDMQVSGVGVSQMQKARCWHVTSKKECAKR